MGPGLGNLGQMSKGFNPVSLCTLPGDIFADVFIPPFTEFVDVFKRQ